MAASCAAGPDIVGSGYGVEYAGDNGSIHVDDSSMLPWRLQQRGRLVKRPEQ